MIPSPKYLPLSLPHHYLSLSSLIAQDDPTAPYGAEPVTVLRRYLNSPRLFHDISSIWKGLLHSVCLTQFLPFVLSEESSSTTPVPSYSLSDIRYISPAVLWAPLSSISYHSLHTSLSLFKCWAEWAMVMENNLEFLIRMYCFWIFSNVSKFLVRKLFKLTEKMLGE